MTSKGKTDSGDWWSPTSSHTWYPSHIPDLHLMVGSRLENHRGWLDQDNSVKEKRFPERKLSLPTICSRSIQEPNTWYKPTLQSPSLVQASTTIIKDDMEESPTLESEGEDTVEEEELEDNSDVTCTPEDGIDFLDQLSQKFWEEVYDSDFNTVWVITSCDRPSEVQSTDTDDFYVPPRNSQNSENLHQLTFGDNLQSQMPSDGNIVQTAMGTKEMTSNLKTSSGKKNYSCGQGLKSWFTRKLRKIA